MSVRCFLFLNSQKKICHHLQLSGIFDYVSLLDNCLQEYKKDLNEDNLKICNKTADEHVGLALDQDLDGYGLQCAGFAGNQMKYLKEVSTNLKNSGWNICDEKQSDIGDPDCVRVGFFAPPPVMIGNNSRNVKPGKEPWGRGTTGASGVAYYVEKMGEDGKPRKAVLVGQDRCAGYCYQKEGRGCVKPTEKEKQFSLGWKDGANLSPG